SILSRVSASASSTWVHRLPVRSLTPRPTPHFKKVLRSIPCERIETSIVIIDELFYRAFLSRDLHVPSEHFLVGPHLPAHVLCDAVNVREVIQRNERSLVHNNFPGLLQYGGPFLEIGRLLLLLDEFVQFRVAIIRALGRARPEVLV